MDLRQARWIAYLVKGCQLRVRVHGLVVSVFTLICLQAEMILLRPLVIFYAGI
jgi:hypothetical protein